jgi:hypothetical protein
LAGNPWQAQAAFCIFLYSINQVAVSVPDDSYLSSGAQMSMDLNNPQADLPPQDEFPLNIKEEGRLIKRIIEADVNQSANCLIVTGIHQRKPSHLCLVIGLQYLSRLICPLRQRNGNIILPI